MFRDSRRARRRVSIWWQQGANWATSTPRSRRPKPRQEEQAPMECIGKVVSFFLAFCPKVANEGKEVDWTVRLRITSVLYTSAVEMVTLLLLLLLLFGSSCQRLIHSINRYCGLNDCHAFKPHLSCFLAFNLHLSSMPLLCISFHTFLGQSPLTMYHSTLFMTHYLMMLGTGYLSHISEMLVFCKESKLFSLPSPLFFYKVLLLLYCTVSPTHHTRFWLF